MKKARHYLTLEGKQHFHDLCNGKDRGKPYAETEPMLAEPVAAWLVESGGEQKVFISPVTVTIEQMVDIVKSLKWRKRFTIANVQAAHCAVVPGGRFEFTYANKVSDRLEVL